MPNEDLNPYEVTKDLLRSAYTGDTLNNMIHKMGALRAKKDKLEDELKGVNAEYDLLRLELIPTKMEQEGVERIVVAGVGRVSLTGDLYVKVSDQEQFHHWLHDRNLGDLIKETVAPSTLKAFVKGRIKDSKELPPMLDIKPFTRAAITKG